MNQDSEMKQQIAQCLSLLKQIFGNDLLGVYLYGSSVVGGLQKFSDIDIFVISNRPSTKVEKIKLAKEILSISGIYLKSVKRAIEMTIVVKSEVNPWQYPPTFDFQYGDWLRKEFESGNYEPWDNKEMPDLALLVTQILLSNEILFGPTPEKILKPVPYEDFISATVEEADNLLIYLDEDTLNILLTFARMWSTVETDSIRSKPAAATWAIDRLPTEYKTVIQRAQAVCVGEEQEHWEDLQKLIKPCAEFMVDKIKKQIALLQTSNNTNRTITIAR